MIDKHIRNLYLYNFNNDSFVTTITFGWKYKNIDIVLQIRPPLLIEPFLTDGWREDFEHKLLDEFNSYFPDGGMYDIESGASTNMEFNWNSQWFNCDIMSEKLNQRLLFHVYEDLGR